MFNCAVLMGRLTADPVLKTTASGKEVCRFGIAVERGGAERKADFINIVAWDSGARFVTTHFSKGSMIAVQGSIQTSTYQTQKGEKRTAFEVVARELSFCEKAPASASGTKPAGVVKGEAAEEFAPYYGNATAADFEEITDDEDLPF